MKSVGLLPSPCCRCECRAKAWVEEGRLLGLEGEAAAPPCPACLDDLRRTLAADRPCSPRRPQAARRRKGREERFDEARWDEATERLVMALQAVVEKRRRLLLLSGSQRPSLADVLLRRVAGCVPSATLVRRVPAEETLARWAQVLLPAASRADAAGVEVADLVISWGDLARGPAQLLRSLDVASSRGARHLHLGAVASETARRADDWLALAPGSEQAFALGLAAACRSFTGDRCALSEEESAVLDVWEPHRSARACEIDGEAIDRFAKDLISARSAVLVMTGDVLLHAPAAPTVQAIAILLAVSAARALCPRPARDPSEGLPFPGAVGAVEARASGDLTAVLEARRPENDVVVIEGADPLETWDGIAPLRDYLACAGEVIVLAPWDTRAAAFADLILPVASQLEDAGCVGLRWTGSYREGAAALAPPRGIKTASSIWRGVAHRLGWSLSWFPEDGAGLLAQRQACPSTASVLPGPDKSLSEVMRTGGEAFVVLPGLYSDFPLRLVPAATPLDAPGPPSWQAEPLPVLVLSVADARSRGIQAWCIVRVLSERAELLARVLVDERQPAGVVALSEAPSGGHGGAGDLTRFVVASGGEERLEACLVEVTGV